MVDTFTFAVRPDSKQSWRSTFLSAAVASGLEWKTHFKAPVSKVRQGEEESVSVCDGTCSCRARCPKSNVPCEQD